MFVTINVTEEDIRQGVPCRSYSCPIALAIGRRVKPGIGVGVGHLNMIVTDGSQLGLSVPVPFEARRFVRAFDFHEAVEPFSFGVDIPEQYLKESANVCQNQRH